MRTLSAFWFTARARAPTASQMILVP